MTLSKHLVPKPWGLENRDDLPFSPTKRNKKLIRILPKNFKFELKISFTLIKVFYNLQQETFQSRYSKQFTKG